MRFLLRLPTSTGTSTVHTSASASAGTGAGTSARFVVSIAISGTYCYSHYIVVMELRFRFRPERPAHEHWEQGGEGSAGQRFVSSLNEGPFLGLGFRALWVITGSSLNYGPSSGPEQSATTNLGN